MKAYRARKLWVELKRGLIYLGLGFASALIAVGLSSSFSEPWAGMIRLTVFFMGLFSIQVLVIRAGPEDSK